MTPTTTGVRKVDYDRVIAFESRLTALETKVNIAQWFLRNYLASSRWRSRQGFAFLTP